MKIKKSLLLIVTITIIILTFGFKTSIENQEFEFMQFTTIESVVPMGLGRSRLITTNEDGALQEIKMKNFFSATGINFKNVRMNDQMITNKINTLYELGWELESSTTGVYSGESSTGIFITRYLFKRLKEQ